MISSASDKTPVSLFRVYIDSILMIDLRSRSTITKSNSWWPGALPGKLSLGPKNTTTFLFFMGILWSNLVPIKIVQLENFILIAVTSSRFEELCSSPSQNLHKYQLIFTAVVISQGGFFVSALLKLVLSPDWGKHCMGLNWASISWRVVKTATTP